MGWCVQHMYDSRTLHLAVGMPLQVETLQKEVQHLRKASMLHSHTKPLHVNMTVLSTRVRGLPLAISINLHA